MLLAQRLSAANDNHQLSRAMAALVASLIALFGLVAAVVFLGTRPTLASSAAPKGDRFVDTPACRAALAQAKSSRDLPSQEAVAASTAMLRVCRRG